MPSFQEQGLLSYVVKINQHKYLVEEDQITKVLYTGLSAAIAIPPVLGIMPKA